MYAVDSGKGLQLTEGRKMNDSGTQDTGKRKQAEGALVLAVLELQNTVSTIGAASIPALREAGMVVHLATLLEADIPHTLISDILETGIEEQSRCEHYGATGMAGDWRGWTNTLAQLLHKYDGLRARREV